MAEDDAIDPRTGQPYWAGTQYNSPDMRAYYARARQIWKQLQEHYPQYTRGVKFAFLPDAEIKRRNGKNYDALAYGSPSTGVVLNSDWLPQLAQDDQTLRGTITKELGQAVSERMLGSKSRADELMRLWGHDSRNVPNNQRYMSGLPGATWNGDTGNIARRRDAITVGGYTSFPEDVYGIQFGASLGGKTNSLEGRLSPQANYAAQQQGLVPTPYHSGGGGHGAPMVSKSAYLRMVQQKQAEEATRNAQQVFIDQGNRNMANVAMRGGGRRVF